MTQGPNIQARLREGIDAAKRGDRLTARRLLQQVLAFDRDNELALMWMASVVDTIEERRSFLQRALQVNPDNARAREALRRLGDTSGTAMPGSAPSSAGSPALAGGSLRSNNVYLWLAGAVVLIVAVILGVILLNPSRNQTPTATISNIQRTFIAAANPSVTPSPDRRPPTATVFTGVIVTFDPNTAPQLPPTFTPTFVPTSTPTPLPSATPLPLSDFSVVYGDIEPNASAPSLYSASANGTNEIKLESGTLGGFTDAAVSPDGRSVAFVREIATDEAEPKRYPQLFIAPLENLPAAQPVTRFTGSILAGPSWSADSSSIVFSSNHDVDEEIYRYDVQSGNLRQLTRNQTRDFDPAFSPDGSLIVFASDVDSPDFSEIYQMTREGAAITRLTEDSGSSFSPAYAPNGARIAFISDRQGDADLFIIDADGQRPFMLTVDDNGAEDRSPIWSPDSRWIVFASNRELDRFAWYAIDLSGAIQALPKNDRLPQSLTFIAQSP
ncbi:MAG: DPP IV N-terminal domain-containing protein [Anaerolineae bacterium]|nr:DPP IV N-terminal domain-containing protein [Anaerolineae bacterium]NUQ03158.1 PD40 domain-containing protein [Anaerolineae bacterium]